ncbi:hypothetical protein HBI31_174130 [Parastagonospora nodorum]|nr:hypothetical protein HBI31_174130 [Parastagonospora nodorum]
MVCKHFAARCISHHRATLQHAAVQRRSSCSSSQHASVSMIVTVCGPHIWTGPRILFLDEKCCTGSRAEWTCSSEHAAVDPLEQSAIFCPHMYAVCGDRANY